MSGTAARRRLIRSLIRDTRVGSQSELVELLVAEGHEVTQATVSRDLSSIGAFKEGDGYRIADARFREHEPLAHALETYAETIHVTGNIVVIRTPPGAAHLVAAALDAAEIDGVLGTVAGDDTIFVRCRRKRLGAPVSPNTWNEWEIDMKVVLAYSGGLDTSVILAWLKEEYGAEVYCYTADVGQGEEVTEALEKAYATGAVDARADDLREEFVRDAVFPAIRANAVYENYYLLGTSLARPIITQGLMRYAAEVGADAISHGATGKGNDQVRFELAAYAIDPAIKVIAPWREWSLRGRADCVEYAESRGIPVPVTFEKPFSMDANLLHISYEGGVLEDPWEAPPKGMFRMTVDPELAEDAPQWATISYEAGTPVAIDGEEMDPVSLLERANDLAGRHGIGRVDIVENRFVGMKSRGVYETPGGTLLHHGHRAVESITLDREVAHLRDELVPRYADMVYNGFWFSPEREALQAFMDNVQTRVNGEARLKLYKGTATIEGRRSDNHDLYDQATVTFEEDDVYNQADAAGFIRLNALRLRRLAEHRLGGGE